MIAEMLYELPTFRGYTVDKRLRQFRRIIPGFHIEFIEFDSKEGNKLLKEMRDYFSFLQEERS